MEKIIFGLLNTKLKHSLVIWLHNVRKARIEEEAALKVSRFRARMFRGGTHRIFLTWVDFWIARHHQRDLMNRMILRMANEGKIAGFALMHRNMVIIRDAETKAAEDKLKIERFTARLRNTGTFKVWHTWIQFVDWRHNSRRLVGAVFNRISNNKLSTGFVTWKTYFKRCRKLSHFLAKLSNRSVYRVWLGWIDFLKVVNEERCLLDQTMHRVIRRFVSVTLSDALNIWKAETWDSIQALLDKILTDERWDLKFIGMQIIIEGLALAAFNLAKQTSNDPVFRDMLYLIIRDEARHVTFGVNYLEEYLKNLSKEMGMKSAYVAAERDFFTLADKFFTTRVKFGKESWDKGNWSTLERAICEYQN